MSNLAAVYLRRSESDQSIRGRGGDDDRRITGPQSILKSFLRSDKMLVLIGRGLSNAELAEHLGIGPGTVKTHVRNLLTKLGVRDRVHLFIAAYDAGLVTPAR
ncbi:response regulator transcription factor [Streptomyces avidinii]|uniref:DNA-binding NarL/FixJ family response regulator n=1 Tax=Streptomyces avidinii TaxID=1895 RepID=A0ABS4LFM0_STRAV|nr:LuxR C-terminal-related transcriptional regulator [Streptomyces avidinii]MBP2040894.1 DNA-binding NarL/FixJ family response regulator [Streptomyces avidinii]GGZ06102.1 hypothetical protein GCM10010343_34990 [Streptomyces avidinii]